MTIEHIRPLLNNARILHSFFQMCERLAQAKVPQAVVEAVRVGRMTAEARWWCARCRCWGRDPTIGKPSKVSPHPTSTHCPHVLGASALPMFCKACASRTRRQR